MPEREPERAEPDQEDRDRPCPQEVLEAAMAHGWVPHNLPSRDTEAPT